MFQIQTILHPTDFSLSSHRAFVLACALARAHGARVVVLHVMRRPMAAGLDLAPIAPRLPDYRAEMERTLRWVESPDPQVRVERWLEEGEPASEILRVAREAHCDLIVMGTHGRTGLGRLLLGSVAERVLRRAPCPVLTARAGEEASEGAGAAETARHPVAAN